MRSGLAGLMLVCVAGCGAGDEVDVSEAPVSELRADETVVLFPTSGWLDESAATWNVPVHGWIYEPEDSSARLQVFRTVLEQQFGLTVTPANQANFSRRVNLLIADNERDKQIVIELADRTFVLPATAENGHFRTTIQLAEADVAEYAEDGFLSYRVVSPRGDSRRFSGRIQLIGPRGISVVSDIDDTVKISNVRDRKSLLEHTFLLDFQAVPGMGERYQDWAARAASFHFVSSSPWQLYEPLSELLGRDFPQATYSLKSIRFRDETLLDLFKPGTETKPAAIAAILDRYPAREFVLVGDSGEQDPEVYAELMRARPEQIRAIAIRNVTNERADGERFASIFEGLDPSRWQLFLEPAVLSDLDIGG